jgi:hypothetical protein
VLSSASSLTTLAFTASGDDGDHHQKVDQRKAAFTDHACSSMIANLMKTYMLPSEQSLIRNTNFTFVVPEASYDSTTRHAQCNSLVDLLFSGMPG